MIISIMFPKTLQEAVALVISHMSSRDKLLLRNTKKEDLVKFHLNFGREIRLVCGLWAGNAELIKDVNENHPDSASLRIMEAVWEELQKE